MNRKQNGLKESKFANMKTVYVNITYATGNMVGKITNAPGIIATTSMGAAFIISLGIYKKLIEKYWQICCYFFHDNSVIK